MSKIRQRDFTFAEELPPHADGVMHAYIVYTHGFEERRGRAIEWLEGEGIIPLGRFGRYDYFNSDQCVIAARELAAVLLERRSAGGQAD